MTIDELLVYAKKYIHKDQAKILLADLIGKNPLELLICLDEKIDDNTINEYKKRVQAIKEGRPIQYVMGYVNFYGNKFFVNDNVLIPRFETEELVEKTLNYINNKFSGDINIIDLGCGSGNIGLTLKSKLPDASIDMIDISDDALLVSKRNADNLGLDVNIYKSDFFDNVNKKYDVIISNAPYIKIGEEIEDIVKNNEPELALYAGLDGLDSYRKIFKNISNYLKDKFLIAIEIGKDQKEDIINLINSHLNNVKIEILQDLSLKNRIVLIYNE